MFNKFLEEREAIMNMLDKDLEEAETQQRRAVQQHQENQTSLKILQEGRIMELEQEWESTVNELKKEQVDEMKQLDNWYQGEQLEMQEIFKLLQDYRVDRNKENHEGHDNDTEAIKNKYSEQFQEMKNTLDSKLDKLNDTFTKC